MSFARIYSAQTHLLKGKIVTIEVDITKNTLHAFTLVGLPDKAVDESKDRMSSALKNSGFASPKTRIKRLLYRSRQLILRKRVRILM
jgi:magnesium chelatase family protein